MTSRAPVLVGAIALAVFAAVAERVATPGAGASTARAHGTNFFSECRFSHAASDDPIVHYGMRGRSHPHAFFGNTSTNANSTLATLLMHGTTCKRSADTAAYWVPVLYRYGHVVKPIRLSVYYQIQALGKIRPFPAGLKIVAGNPGAVTPQSTRTVFWNCTYPPGPSKHVASPPMCPERRPSMMRHARDLHAHLHLNVSFPDCWDGKHLDSHDHHAHMAYSTNLHCPASHPVKVPRIRLTVSYPVRGGDDLALASGGIYSGHADFFNAWDQRELTRLVEQCAAEVKRCSRPAGSSRR